MRRALSALLLTLLSSAVATAQDSKKPPDESLLGEFVVTGTNTQEHIPKIAILPSLSPDLEDVIVRGVVRRDFELTGMFDVISDSKAPPGLYGFDDPVDVDAWRKLGAESIVKVAARATKGSKIEVFGLAYFLNVGKDPVYEKKLLVDKSDVRVTAHRITDALLGALTGRPGGFASHFTFSGKWGKNRRVFTMDSDGHDLKPFTNPDHTAIAPTWGPNQSVFYADSKNYAPFKLMAWDGKQSKPIPMPTKGSVYGVAFNKDHSKMAVALAEPFGSAIWVGNPDGSGMKKVSTTPIATHPAFSPSGKLGWIGGDPKKRGGQRVYVDGKAVSPPGFTAAAPVFCDTEDGIRLVYSVAVGGDRQDIVMSNEKGQGISRLTQNMGTNKYPACSPDGRLLAFFSTRKKSPGIYFLSLKRWRTNKLNGQMGESLRWEPLPPPAKTAAP
ncbi:MAG: PD40 domain-containing protein [Myxococcales bacterium]|nr:PD40 domain-containing protein [Myxococcales bacterium]MCB9582698.1 PD40 domain-containing protein [Polyangiaceae bacterium]